MAIIYSYPHAVPTVNDMVLGAKFRENEGISTNSFYISDIVTLVQEQVGTIPTLQEVTEQGANTTDQIQINGIDVATINDIPGTPTFQEVVDEGNISTTPIYIGDDPVQSSYLANDRLEITYEGGGFEFFNQITASTISIFDNVTNKQVGFSTNSGLNLKTNGTGYFAILKSNLLTTQDRIFQFPDQAGTLALTTDIPTPAYRVYTAILTQSGTNAPVATVLENTLGGTVTFEYTGPGLYNAVLAGEFTINKTIAMLWGGTSSQLFKAFSTTIDRVVLVTYNTAGLVANDQMGITTLEIRVYN
jgi:hypothetical protein